MENQPIVHVISDSPCTDMSGQANLQGTQVTSGSVPLQIRDAQESLRVLKNQIAFAQQCLSLLNNQMKHAEDTLGILQDQIVKAEETISQIRIPLQCAAGKEHNSIETGAAQSFRHISLTHNQTHPDVVLRDSPVDCQGCKMSIRESAGQRVVVLDKETGMTFPKDSNTVCRQTNTSSTNSVPCSCPNCSDVVIIEKGNNVVSTAATTTTSTVDTNKPAAHERSKCEAAQPGETSKFPTREVIVMSQYAANTQPQVTQGSQVIQGSQVSAQEVEGVQSTSPMASQLLQVIDVLQSAVDDEPKSGCVLTPNTPLSAASTHSSGFVYTVPPPESGVMQMASYAFPRERTPRKSRKQTSSPQISPTVNQSAGPVDQEYKVRHYGDLKELMIVPQPVLASTLEPEFIVVPSTGGMASPEPLIPEGETISFSDPIQQSSSSDRKESTRTTPSSDIKQEPPDSPGTSDTMPRCASTEIVYVRAADVSTKSDQFSFTTQADETSPHSKSRKQKFNECQHSKSNAMTKSSLLNQPFTAVQSHSTTSLIQTTECAASSSLSPTASSHGSMLAAGRSVDSTNGVAAGNSPLKARASDVQTFPSNSHCPVSVLNAPAAVTSSRQSQSLAVTQGVQTQARNSLTHSTTASSQFAGLVAQSLTSLPFVVTANSVAQTKTTPSPRRPNILSRKRDRSEQKNSMPEGLVVLVPTLEDAKKLISSTGRQGRTPVLVPEHLAQSFQNVEQNRSQETDDTLELTVNTVSTPNKRIHQSPLNTPEPATKRRNIEPVLLE